MKAFQIFHSMKSWQKLANVALKPKIAFQILRYTKLVDAEFQHIEKQRIAIVYEVSGTPEGQSIEADENSPWMPEFYHRFNEVLQQESTLSLLRLDLETVVNALDGKDDVVSVSDLAILEPFFQYPEPPLDDAIDVEAVEVAR